MKASDFALIESQRISPLVSNMSVDYKLFVGNLPPDVTEGELLKLFCDYGELLEVFVMGGERSRSGQSSAFVKYSTFEACEKAIAAVNQRGKIRPTDSDAVVVKYAKATTVKRDNKRELPEYPQTSAPSTSSVDAVATKHHHPPLCKLFVGGLPSFVDRDDLIAIFCPFGHIDSVHLMQGKSKSGQACAFITYQYPGPAQRAIDGLSTIYVIDDTCPPISVRFADSEVGTTVAQAPPPPKRQKQRGPDPQGSPITQYLRDPIEAAAAVAAVIGNKGG